MTTTSTTSRAWNPTDRDRMIYRWVKFDGHKQSWVADQLDLNQSTVSRILDRYERWIAHGGPANEGSPSRDERLRAQRYLTYERNEWILTSALRIAGEMEHMSDTSKSTTTHHCSDPSREIEVRTENSIRDRTGTVCRYLCLAHRVNMDQLKLVEQDDLPVLDPLTLDTNEYSQAVADSRSGFQASHTPFESVPSGAGFQPAEEAFGAGLPTPPDPDHTPAPSSFVLSPSSLSPAQNSESRAPDSAPMPATHNQQSPKSPLTSAHTITSLEISPYKKPTLHAYALPQNPPEPTDQLDPILDATNYQPPPPIRILPIHMPLGAP